MFWWVLLIAWPLFCVSNGWCNLSNTETKKLPTKFPTKKNWRANSQTRIFPKYSLFSIHCRSLFTAHCIIRPFWLQISSIENFFDKNEIRSRIFSSRLRFEPLFLIVKIFLTWSNVYFRAGCAASSRLIVWLELAEELNNWRIAGCWIGRSTLDLLADLRSYTDNIQLCALENG